MDIPPGWSLRSCAFASSPQRRRPLSPIHLPSPSKCPRRKGLCLPDSLQTVPSTELDTQQVLTKNTFPFILLNISQYIYECVLVKISDRVEERPFSLPPPAISLRSSGVPSGTQGTPLTSPRGSFSWVPVTQAHTPAHTENRDQCLCF